MWEKVHEFTTKVSNFPIFDNAVPIWDTLQKLTLIRKPIGSGMKHVATVFPKNIRQGYLHNAEQHYLKTEMVLKPYLLHF